MSDVTILKVKLVKKGEKLEVSLKETGGKINFTDNKVCDNPVHQDLKNAITSLNVHLAILTDYITEKQAKDQDELAKFTVTGYSMGGADDDEGVIITGYRTTKSGKTVTLNSPFLKLEPPKEDNGKGYFLLDDLVAKIDVIEDEVLEYLKGKTAPVMVQTEMELEEAK